MKAPLFLALVTIASTATAADARTFACKSLTSSNDFKGVETLVLDEDQGFSFGPVKHAEIESYQRRSGDKSDLLIAHARFGSSVEDHIKTAKVAITADLYSSDAGQVFVDVESEPRLSYSCKLSE